MLSLVGERAVLDCSGNDKRVVSRTHQSFKKDADINNILAKYKKTGFLVDPLMVNVNRHAMFGDFSDFQDYGTIMNRITAAQQCFARLPAAVRAKFDNDLQKCIDFMSDAANVEEAIELGLLPESARPVIQDGGIPSNPPKEGGVPPVGGAQPNPPTGE